MHKGFLSSSQWSGELGDGVSPVVLFCLQSRCSLGHQKAGDMWSSLIGCGCLSVFLVVSALGGMGVSFFIFGGVLVKRFLFLRHVYCIV